MSADPGGCFAVKRTLVSILHLIAFPEFSHPLFVPQVSALHGDKIVISDDHFNIWDDNTEDIFFLLLPILEGS